jgi:hypothetical protein
MRAAWREYGAAGGRLSGGLGRRIAIHALESGGGQHSGPRGRGCCGRSGASTGATAQQYPVRSTQLDAVHAAELDTICTTKLDPIGAAELDPVGTTEHDANHAAQFDPVAGTSNDDTGTHGHDRKHEPAASRHEREPVTRASRYDRNDGIAWNRAGRLSPVWK